MLAQLLERLAFLTPPAAKAKQRRGRPIGRDPWMWAGLVLVHVVIGTASAQSGQDARNVVTSASSLRAQLHSADPRVVEAALDARLAAGGSDEARRSRGVHPADEALLLSAFLAEGQPDGLTQKALRRLGALPEVVAHNTLLRFTSHHRAAARRAALSSLATQLSQRTGAARRAAEAPTRRALEYALGDRDHAVRAAAAKGLVVVGAGPSLARLWAAFEAGVQEAAEGIGATGDVPALERFHGYLESRPLSAMLLGYQAFLSRPELPVTAKRGIVLRLREVGSSQSRVFLQAYLRTMPSDLRRQAPEWVAFVAKAIAAIDVDASVEGRRRRGQVSSVDDEAQRADEPAP